MGRGPSIEGRKNAEDARRGIAIIIDCMTDHQQRTVADVRSSLTKHGGNLGTSGSVAFQFKHQGELVFATPDAASEEKVLEVALEAGADDVQAENGQSTVLCTQARDRIVDGANVSRHRSRASQPVEQTQFASV